MANKVRSYKGNLIDIDEILQKGQNVVAIGNQNVNARGDIIDNQGNVIKTHDEVVRDYNKNVQKSVVKSSLLDDIDDELPTIKDDPNVIKKQQAKTAQVKETKVEKTDTKEDTTDNSKGDNK